MTRTEQILTAEQGADRVLARGRRSHMCERDDEGPGYSCENCGHNEFHLIEEFAVTGEYERVLSCSCGNHENAAARCMKHWTRHQVTYVLDDEHRPSLKLDSEQLDDREEDELYFEIDCQECYEADFDDEQAWETEEEESEIEDVEFTVCCAECGHEIEFGWSHPDRGGRIWPVEAEDFNPWRSWPEPRFVEAWARRGWLRPARWEAPRA